jgi:hypothetical protein
VSILDLQGMKTAATGVPAANSGSSKGCGNIINVGGERNSGLSVACELLEL